MSKAWQDFLDSLSTRGGNIFMLFCCLTILLGVMIHISHDSRDSTLMAVAHDMVVGFGGALLGSLSGGTSRQQMADRVDTAIAGQKINVTSSGTVNVDKPPSDPTPSNPVPTSPWKSGK